MSRSVSPNILPSSGNRPDSFMLVSQFGVLLHKVVIPHVLVEYAFHCRMQDYISRIDSNQTCPRATGCNGARHVSHITLNRDLFRKQIKSIFYSLSQKKRTFNSEFFVVDYVNRSSTHAQLKKNLELNVHFFCYRLYFPLL